MQPKPHTAAGTALPLLNRLIAAAALFSVALSATGCLSALNKHSTALADATAPVIDQATATYRDVQALHDRSVDTDAVTLFDLPSPVYNPRGIKPLLSEKDIQVRLAILLALQCYAKTLVEITAGTSSPALDAASKSAASALAGLGDDLAPVLGIPASSTSSTVTQAVTTGGATTTSTITTSAAADAISPAVKAGVGTAIDALGQFLVARKIKKELPAKIEAMDPHVQALAKLLLADIDTLQNQEKLDYDNIIDGQTAFIRQSGQGGHPALAPEQRRLLIMQLPGIVREQRKTDEELTQLKASLIKLANTHHALAAEAQGNNPASFKSKIADLSAAGDNLGKFYSTASAK